MDDKPVKWTPPMPDTAELAEDRRVIGEAWHAALRDLVGAMSDDEYALRDLMTPDPAEEPT